MSKLDQRIAEINAKILVLAGRKSRLLAIKFGAKGGEGSGRYPAGSGEAQNTVGAKYTREAVGSLKTASWTRKQIDTSKGDAKVKSELRDLKITATGQVFESEKDGGDSREATQSDVVNTIQSVLGMHPADYREAMLNKVTGVGENAKMIFDILEDKEYGKTTVTATLKDLGKQFVMTRSFVLTTKGVKDENGKIGDGKITITNDLFLLSKRDQDKGFGKQITQNLVALADHIGASKIDLEANVDVGGYAWAKYGFAPEPSSFKFLAQSIRDDNSKKIASLTPSQKTELDEVLDNWTRPDAIQELAALDFKDPKAKEPFGKEMLLKSSWLGSIDLSDNKSYTTIRAYCAKRKG